MVVGKEVWAPRSFGEADLITGTPWVQVSKEEDPT